MNARSARPAIALVSSLVALIAAFTFAAFAIVNGHWNGDSGWYLLRAAALASGERPYFDYATIYPPLLDILHSIPIALGVDRYAIALLIPYAWNIASAAVSAMLARSLGWSKAASLAAAAGFLVFSIENEGNHVMLEHGVVFFSLVAMLALTWRTDLTRGQLFVCGLAMACATLSKQNGIVALLTVVAILFERRQQIRRSLVISLLAGFALPFVLVLAYLDFNVALIYRETVEALIFYAEESSPGLLTLPWEYIRSRPSAVFLPTLGVLGVVAVAAGPRRGLATAALAAATIQFLPRLLRPYGHYNLNIWPFALLIIILAAGAASNRHVRSLTRSAAAAMLAGTLLAYSLIPLRWTIPGNLPALFRPAAASIRAVTRDSEPFRMYSVELIIPFLADRPLDPNLSPLSGIARTALLQEFNRAIGEHALREPIPDMPVVVVDIGDRWVSGLDRRLRERGFRVLLDDQSLRDLRLTVYDRPEGAREAR